MTTRTRTPKRILITFARTFLALHLARQLHAAGHRVYVADSIDHYVTRFSNAVTKHFKVSSPRYDTQAYVDELIKITEDHKIDFVLPMYEEISYLASAHHRFPKNCQLFCPSFDLYETLHNKWSFHSKLEELGIPTLQAAQVKSTCEVPTLKFTTPFALKACFSRASQTIKKVYPQQHVHDIEIEAHNPWIAQEWLEGHKFCTYTVCHEGKIYAHAVYPVHYAIDGNSCLTFKSVEHPSIYRWIENFVAKVNYTGQIAFDFIESSKQEIYAIECNPRATSGVLLFNEKTGVDQAFFKENTSPIFPKKNAKKQVATGMLMYGWRKSALPGNNFFKFAKTFCSTKDVVFKLRDLKPFLLSPLIFTSIWKNSRKYKLNIVSAFTHDHDWNGEKLKN